MKKTKFSEKIKKHAKKAFEKMRSLKIWLLVCIILIVTAAMLIIDGFSYYFFNKNFIENELAQMQTSAAVMAGEFSSYETLSDADRDGIYDNMKRYSAINSVRIRIVDERVV